MEEKKKEVLFQPQDLVNTSYEISALDNRIYYYLLFQVQKEKEDLLSLSVKVSKKDLFKLIKHKTHRNSESLNEIFSTLLSTQLYFIFNDKNNTKDCAYTLISGYEYSSEDETYEIFFMKRIYNYLKEYTQYAPLDLDILSKLDTFYSQKFYALFRMWSRTDSVITQKFTLEFLRKYLSIENKYPEYKNFKQKILVKSLKKLNDLACIKIEYTEIKKGRKVVAIEFKILDKLQKIYHFNELKKCEEVKKIEENYYEEEKFVDVPNKSFFDNYNLKKFVKYCYDNTITFKDSDYNKIFLLSINALANKKDIDITKLKIKSLGDYSYFIETLKGKINDFEEKEKKI